MAHLQKLKLTKEIKRVAADPMKQRRGKLIAKLEEQKAIAEADFTGKEFIATKKVWLENEAGVKELVERKRKVRRWYWRGTDSWFLHMRYGAKIVNLGNGNNAIEAKSDKELLGVLDTCIEAVKAGELDKAIEEMAAIKSKLI